MKRIAKISTIISGIMCVLMIAMLPISYYLGVFESDTNGSITALNYVRITSHFYVRFFHGGIWFSMHELPYMGSVHQIADGPNRILYENGVAHQTRNREWRIGTDSGFRRVTYVGEKNEYVEADAYFDFPGIYFRHFNSWKSEQSDWTLMLSLVYVIGLTAIAPAIWAFRAGRDWFLARKQNPAPASYSPPH